VIKLVLWGVRRPGITSAEYFEGNHRVHGDLVRNAPEDFRVFIKRYTQSYVVDAAYGHSGAKAFDSVSELWFESPERLIESFGHPYYQGVIIPDGARFADEAENVVHVAVEEIVGNAPLRGEGLKVLHWLQAADGLADGRFEEWWTSSESTAPGDWALGHTRNRLPPEAPPMLGDPPTAYEALWIDGPEEIPAFEAYARALVAAGVEAGVLDGTRCSFLLCHERRVVDTFLDAS